MPASTASSAAGNVVRPTPVAAASRACTNSRRLPPRGLQRKLLRRQRDLVEDVLIDDVDTTGARICAAARFLVGIGVAVNGRAFAMARTAHKKGEAVKTLILPYDPWPAEPEGESPF